MNRMIKEATVKRYLVNATAALAGGVRIIVSKSLASASAMNLPEDDAETDQPHELLEAYQTWLFHEFHAMCDEMSPEGKHRHGDWTYCNNAGDRFHWVGYGAPKPPPSTRAAAVLAAVGCRLRLGKGGGRRQCLMISRASD